MVSLIGGTGPLGPPTSFPSGLLSMGVPTMGMAGLPLTTGRVIFCDAVNGNDGNQGGGEDPVQTLTQAYSLATDGNNDVIVIVGDGSTAATQRLSSTLTWAKDATHLVGMTAPNMFNKRARISTASGATANVNPLIEVSAQGCVFANFSIFQGVGQSATDEQCLLVSGQRNYFQNVDIQGIGAAAGAARAGSYNLKLYGGSENTFVGCTIGTDTIARSAANSNVLLRKNASNVASTRNVFIGCIFPMLASASTPIFIDSNESGGIDRFALFSGCWFLNAVNSTGTALAAVVAFNASQGGSVIIDATTGGAVGANDWTASDTATVKILGPVPNGDTTGQAADANAT